METDEQAEAWAQAIGAIVGKKIEGGLAPLMQRSDLTLQSLSAIANLVASDKKERVALAVLQSWLATLDPSSVSGDELQTVVVQAWKVADLFEVQARKRAPQHGGGKKTLTPPQFPPPGRSFAEQGRSG